MCRKKCYYEYDYEQDYEITMPTDSAYLSKELAVQKIDREEWKKLTKDVDYSEEERKNARADSKVFQEDIAFLISQ